MLLPPCLLLSCLRSTHLPGPTGTTSAPGRGPSRSLEALDANYMTGSGLGTLPPGPPWRGKPDAVADQLLLLLQTSCGVVPAAYVLLQAASMCGRANLNVWHWMAGGLGARTKGAAHPRRAAAPSTTAFRGRHVRTPQSGGPAAKLLHGGVLAASGPPTAPKHPREGRRRRHRFTHRGESVCVVQRRGSCEGKFFRGGGASACAAVTRLEPLSRCAETDRDKKGGGREEQPRRLALIRASLRRLLLS